ncbi:MAG: molybdopterin-binding/glycosyltransferase family 2 protein [Pseudomonadota bacterium]
MKFGPVPVDDAEGSILAHSMGLSDRRLKKGRTLTAADVADLSVSGFDTVVVATPESGDVLEDTAAGQLASALAPNPEALNLRVGAPFTGRANLYAETAGVLELDAVRVNAFNAVDEAVTLATLPNLARVTARQMVGTVKIIPYGCSGEAVTQAEAVLSTGPVMRVHPVRTRLAHLILTRTPGMRDKAVTKGADAVKHRLTALGIDLSDQSVVRHDIRELSDAIAKVETDMVLILTGSATSDRHDVGPAALTEAGGQLTRFGMPVDPGNLLFLGSRAGTPVIGLPGCARSPKLNGADWIIERIACGLEVSQEEIGAMGVGGLLKEIPSRPQPRDGASTTPQRPEIAALLLAAGGSTRMRGADKLLEPVDGKPLLRRTAERLLESGVDKVLCVLRPDHDARRAALQGLEVTQVTNPRSTAGMATSIAAGIAALPSSADAALVMMADMPDIESRDIDRLIAAFDPGEDRAIVRAATSAGAYGHPVIFGSRFFEALRSLDGDRGARTILDEHPDYIADVVLSDAAAITDLDTPEDWAAWRSRRHAGR